MRSLYILLLVILLPGSVLSQNAEAELDINDALAKFFSNGMIGKSGGPSNLGYFIPANSDLSPLYVSGIWIAGIDENGQLRVAANMYGFDHDFHPGPLTIDGSASIPSSVSQDYDRVWKINRAEVLMHQQYHDCLQDPGCDVAMLFPGYQIPEPIMTWPAHGDVSADQALYLGPFIDLDSDGNYSPMAGDHPCVPGDQALYAIFNDNTASHEQSLGLPIGVELHMMPFAYSGSGSALDQTVFIHYRLINRSDQTLNEVFIGTFANGNIGCPNDDFIGSDVGRNMMFFYNWDDIDESCMGTGYGPTPPAFGIVTLKGPSVDPNGMDDVFDLSLPSYNGRGFNDGVIDNECHGLSRVINISGQGPPAMTHPDQPEEYYRYMNAQWKDGVQMEYGGNGYPADTTAYVPAFFMFPWDTDTMGVGTGGTPMPDWREINQTPAMPDRRGLASMGPFTLEAGEEDDILLAYVFARAESGGANASVSALKARVDSVRAFAESIPGIMSPGSLCEGLGMGIRDRDQVAVPLRIRPNPASDRLVIEWPSTGHVHLQIFDQKGRPIIQRSASGGRLDLVIEDLPSGLYHVRCIEADRIMKARFMKQ